MATTSNRTEPARDGCAASQRRAARTTRARFVRVTASAGVAERRVPAALDLDEDGRRAVQGDDVDLPVRVSDISIEDEKRIFFE